MKQLSLTDYPKACERLGTETIRHFISMVSGDEDRRRVRHRVLSRIDMWYENSNDVSFSNMSRKELAEFSMLTFRNGIVTEGFPNERVEMINLMNVVRDSF
ncbi:TPA: hypothetical protein I7730_16125 [Vibrio vulnificus]|uniref:Uncharacterized protein n=1 Tax=Vibrio vulnificus TaxID=672 RepID=A0A8H9N1W6_VIBVL|nr:hypothetical protein [Vibrio vulnificus]HAS8541311.1 hypothetical protein [Vibrio vulnificus]